MQVFIDGEFYDAKDAKVSIFDQGYLYGNGAFTTLMTHEQRMFFVDRHVLRRPVDLTGRGVEELRNAGRARGLDREAPLRRKHFSGSLAHSEGGFAAGQGRHSMTWSARSSSDCGIVSPSAFAVLRLMSNSNFVGCSTGRPAALRPEDFVDVGGGASWRRPQSIAEERPYTDRSSRGPRSSQLF